MFVLACLRRNIRMEGGSLLYDGSKNTPMYLRSLPARPGHEPAIRLSPDTLSILKWVCWGVGSCKEMTEGLGKGCNIAHLKL